MIATRVKTAANLIPISQKGVFTGSYYESTLNRSLAAIDSDHLFHVRVAMQTVASTFSWDENYEVTWLDWEQVLNSNYQWTFDVFKYDDTHFISIQPYGVSDWLGAIFIYEIDGEYIPSLKTEFDIINIGMYLKNSFTKLDENHYALEFEFVTGTRFLKVYEIAGDYSVSEIVSFPQTTFEIYFAVGTSLIRLSDGVMVMAHSNIDYSPTGMVRAYNYSGDFTISNSGTYQFAATTTSLNILKRIDDTHFALFYQDVDTHVTIKTFSLVDGTIQEIATLANAFNGINLNIAEMSSSLLVACYGDVDAPHDGMYGGAITSIEISPAYVPSIKYSMAFADYVIAPNIAKTDSTHVAIIYQNDDHRFLLKLFETL